MCRYTVLVLVLLFCWNSGSGFFCYSFWWLTCCMLNLMNMYRTALSMQIKNQTPTPTLGINTKHSYFRSKKKMISKGNMNHEYWLCWNQPISAGIHEYSYCLKKYYTRQWHEHEKKQHAKMILYYCRPEQHHIRNMQINGNHRWTMYALSCKCR